MCNFTNQNIAFLKSAPSNYPKTLVFCWSLWLPNESAQFGCLSSHGLEELSMHANTHVRKCFCWHFGRNSGQDGGCYPALDLMTYQASCRATSRPGGRRLPQRHSHHLSQSARLIIIWTCVRSTARAHVTWARMRRICFVNNARVSDQSRSQMFVPLAPQTPGNGWTELLFSRTNTWFCVHTAHEYLDLCTAKVGRLRIISNSSNNF
jgi:hypothetical protein